MKFCAWSEKMKDNSKMKVKMLGQFEISYKGVVLNVDTIRSNMIELLLVYLLMNRHKEVLTTEMAEVLWREEESDNPLGALKNLMYRLRRLLKETFGEEDIFITGRGSYTFNPSIDVEIDIDVFEKELNQVEMVEHSQQKVKLISALSLYKGEFLPKQIKHHWILQQNVYYQSLYNNSLKVLLSILENDCEYIEMEKWCIQALKYDSLDEMIHYRFMVSLIKQGKNQLAMDHYLLMKQRLFDELGVLPNEGLQTLYQTLLRKDNDRQLDLVVIQQDLKENKLVNEAFFCDYSIFKEIYRLEARRLERFGISVYCCLITCDVTLPIPQTSKLYASTMKKIMEELKELLLHDLRVGDVIANYSKSQYVCLLPTCSVESTHIIMDRIQTRFKKIEVSKQGKLLFDYKELVLDK